MVFEISCVVFYILYMYDIKYVQSKKNNNSIKIVTGKSGNRKPTLKCLGTTKFCDDIDSSKIIVDDDFVPYTGSTNCFDKQFMKGCQIRI